MTLRIVRVDEKSSRKSRYRRLRHYRRIAHKDHQCHQCNRPIEPGDEYEAYVVVLVAGGIYVAKYHISPPCHEPPDPFDGRNEDELKNTLHEAA